MSILIDGKTGSSCRRSQATVVVVSKVNVATRFCSKS
jgi:hypothetical protein